MATKPVALFAYGEFANVRLTPIELAKLYERFGEKDARRRIEALSAYMESNGKAYKSHYAAIISWALKDRRDNGDIEAAVDDPQPDVDGPRQRDRIEMQRRWDVDAERHKHGTACQNGAVCRYIPAKRPTI